MNLRNMSITESACITTDFVKAVDFHTRVIKLINVVKFSKLMFADKKDARKIFLKAYKNY